MSHKRIFVIIIGLTLLTAGGIVFGAGDDGPTAAETITNISQSRFNASLTSSKQIEAMAGNVTEFDIFAVSSTEAWAGYYGNITGAITLEDAQGNIFYNWTDAEPKGRVYATDSATINWTGVKCFNYTANDAGVINVSSIEASYNIDDTDADGVNETFGDGNIPGTAGGYDPDGGAAHPGFFVGATGITSGTCPATTTYKSSRRSTDDFVEVILTDDDNLIFATIIENDLTDNHTDINGFDGNPHDFQMLVLDDGHAGNTAVTNWFIWLELE